MPLRWSKPVERTNRRYRATIGANRRSKPINGAGRGYSKRSLGKKRRSLQQLGGAGRRIQLTGQTDGVHRQSKPIDGARWGYSTILGREERQGLGAAGTRTGGGSSHEG